MSQEEFCSAAEVVQIDETENHLLSLEKAPYNFQVFTVEEKKTRKIQMGLPNVFTGRMSFKKCNMVQHLLDHVFNP